jgi:serine/threonine protein kinase
LSLHPDRPFQLGDVIAGKYRIEAVIGEGGMGVVAAAQHLRLEQLVAIKFVLPSMIGSRMVVERFLREARATVRLKSAHAARVLDVDTLESGVPYMVMEHLEGADLAQILRLHGPLPIDVASNYAIQACEAVAEAHSLGIIHRDIKPQNLFLTRGVGSSPLIKVLDFGISKTQGGYTSGLTNPHVMMGSPQFMAPEQMQSAPDLDGRADVWALGAVLFRLVSNELPFGAGPLPELCFNVVNGVPRPLAEVLPGAPPAFAAVIARCLERDPARRFATAGDLATALEPFAPPSVHRDVQRARMARPSMLSIPPASQEHLTSLNSSWAPGPAPRARSPWKVTVALVLAGVFAVSVFALSRLRPVPPVSGGAEPGAARGATERPVVSRRVVTAAASPPDVLRPSPPADGDAALPAPEAASLPTHAPVTAPHAARPRSSPPQTPPRAPPKSPAPPRSPDDDIPPFR